VNIFPLLLQLLSGIVGGNLAGVVSGKFDMRLLGNSLVGIVGGGIGGEFYEHLTFANGLGATDVSIFMASVAAGSIGGALAVVIVGWVRSLRGPH
jgi:uncharacterized membrane protein YeaQ/YmgE (transglycosylase-associated protein family)